MPAVVKSTVGSFSGIKEPEEITIDDKELVGKHGLDNTMTYSTSLTPPSKTNFKYKDSVLDKYGRIFK